MPGDYIITMVFRTDGHDISRIFAKKKKKKKKKRIHLNLHIWGGDKPDQGYSSVYMGVCIYTYICISVSPRNKKEHGKFSQKRAL